MHPLPVGTSIQSGEEVAIKLVCKRPRRCLMWHAFLLCPSCLLIGFSTRCVTPCSHAIFCFFLCLSCSLLHDIPVLSTSFLFLQPPSHTRFKPQETCKTKHPQLLYESKLYKILQGGGKQSLGVRDARSALLQKWLCCGSLRAQLSAARRLST